MEARLLLGFDDAQSDSGHGSDEGWEGQGIAVRQAAAALGCRARLGWERGNQTGCAGSLGHGWEGENMKWHVGQPPSPVFISAAW